MSWKIVFRTGNPPVRYNPIRVRFVFLAHSLLIVLIQQPVITRSVSFKEKLKGVILGIAKRK